MQENRYAVGLDIGTDRVKVVVGHVDGASRPTIVGVGEKQNSGMRKGTIIDLDRTAEAVDAALEAAERMSGHEINTATVSINGSHIKGISSKGVIAVGASGHEIGHEDLARVEEAATVVQLPANREILDVTPRSYTLDSQDNIKDPFGMTGVRLEVDAYMITAMAQNVKNLQKVLEMTELASPRLVVAGLAAARAALSDQQRENGVVLVDIGGATTNIAVFEEGDIIHCAVLPIGGNHITNDLAIGLKTDLDIAEKVKLEHAVADASVRSTTGELNVKLGKENLKFDSHLIDDIVDARLEEIFEMVNLELKKVKRAAKLPGGAVISGGTANLKGIASYAREILGVSARVAPATEYGGMKEQVAGPEWATALGLMMIGLDSGATADHESQKGGLGAKLGKLFGGLRSK